MCKDVMKMSAHSTRAMPPMPRLASKQTALAEEPEEFAAPPRQSRPAALPFTDHLFIGVSSCSEPARPVWRAFCSMQVLPRLSIL